MKTYLAIVVVVLSSCQGATNTNIVFATGNPITSNNFHGKVWVNPLIQQDSINRIEVGNVTFSPGARTNWHMHPAGQVLLVTAGVGYYQEAGNRKKILHQGDVVKCAPNVSHWHGASNDREFIQLAITGRENGPTVWQDPVTDKEYNN